MNRYLDLIGQNAKKASLEKINTKVKNKILKRYALLLDKEKNSIIVENAKDIKFALRKGLKKNFECARGLSSFSSDEILRIMGCHSKEIKKILGYVSKSEVIHKDDMVEI